MRLPFRLAAVAALLLPAISSRADTYSLFTLNYDQGYSLSGFDDQGNTYIQDKAISGDEYLHFFNGVLQGPVTTYNLNVGIDGGTPCNPTLPAGFRQDGIAKCNNGRVVFAAEPNSTTFRPNVYTGEPLQLLQTIAGGGLYLNARGDIIIDNEFNDTFYEAIDLTTAVTPEPSSIALLGTSLLGIGAAVRRRLTAASGSR